MDLDAGLLQLLRRNLDRIAEGLMPEPGTWPDDVLSSLKAAVAHHVLPLVRPDNVGPEVESFIAKLLNLNRARTEALHQEWDRVLAAMGQPDVRPIALKGIAAGRALYPSRDLRPLNDIDFYVRPEELEKAEAGLRAAGHSLRGRHSAEVQYCRLDGALADAAPEEVLLLYFKSGDLERARYFVSELLVEVHFSFAYGDLTAYAEGLVRADRPRTEQGYYSLFMLTALHASSHDEMRLIWLCDLALLIKKGLVDWTMVLHDAEQDGLRRVLVKVTRALETLLGAEVPAAVKALLERPTPYGLEAFNRVKGEAS